MNTKDSHSISWDRVKTEFQRIWGYKDFRPPQGEIIRSLLSRQDALVVMPTGGGKSICFQLPALLQTGLTLVVSPLIALMENQVQELREKHLPAALLHSQLPSQQRRQTLRLLEQNRLRLLYLSPETLLSSSVWSLIAHPRILVNGLILDEAHCLVQWGDTFRPAYRRLGMIRSTLLQLKPTQKKFAIAAFTATANPAAQQTIQTVLNLNNPQSFVVNPYRPNLNLNVKTVWTPRGRRSQLLKFIQTRKKQTGLVYVRTRKDSEKLADSLKQQGYQTSAYHAGLSGEERREIEQAWLKGSLKFVVCTSAFGMGINKANVRWVLHFQAPFLLSEYLQEVGRAGRDGKPAMALTLVSEPTGWLYPEDKQRREYLQENWRQQYQQANQLIKKLPKQGEIKEISDQFRNGAITLSLLHSSGQLTWQDPFHYVIHSSSVSFPDHNTKAIKQMTQYLKTNQCRWQFLLEAFGFNQAANSMRCGHCDNCLK
ncbi:ATP-dependent DNA helicase, RecQ family protein [Lyngbya aestuarii BL J]|uniref:ATP-dependent DNA helicase RecQ n=1 Tax=Lyngbya aestuarii BL J TaxID=1348334 RepID=U7QF10_9CYAN|nr:ATP-dependent DNA helicase RecQ [Lyngbya aestuarii]ERT06478.1 ATP-dependent DNA helicase, RecQ family protein [Lyngbya aestuarii BL J]